MRLLWSAAVFAAAASSASAFAPATNGAAVARSGVAMSAVATADVKAAQDASVEKLKAKDASSAALTKDVSYIPHTQEFYRLQESIHTELQSLQLHLRAATITKILVHIRKEYKFQAIAVILSDLLLKRSVVL